MGNTEYVDGLPATADTAADEAPVAEALDALKTAAEGAKVGPADAPTYRVVGPHPVHGTRPGGTFTKQLEPAQEAFFLAVGHIEIVAASEPDSDSGSDPAGSASSAGA